MDAAIGSLTTPMTRERRSPESVQPVAAIGSVPAETASKPEVKMNSQRSVERDTETGSLVYRLVEVSTGFVTVQTPSEARLKLRAYIDGVTAQSASEPTVAVTA